MKTFYRIAISAVLPAIFCLQSCSTEGGDEPDNPDRPAVATPYRAKFKAVDYAPAPGQFVNEMPRYEAGDTRASINAKALEALNNGNLISLGALGGSITLTLETPVYRSADGSPEFRVLGNCYLTGSDGNRIFGAAEPGMVWVMKDSNRNGLADDTWYRFVGDMADKITTVSITYKSVAEPVASRWVDWSTDNGQNGALTCNTAYHNHTYFPQWIYGDGVEATFTISCPCLPANGFLEQSSGLYRQVCYPGFADCFPNNDIRSAFSIADVVDMQGNAANIDRIDFIRVVTAVIDSNGPLGETSTEVGGIEVLQ